MITELTQEQKDLMPVYRDKWIKLGLATDRFTKEEAQKWSDYFYTNIRKKDKVPVIVTESPLSAWIIVNLFAFAEKGYKLTMDKIPASVRDSVGDSVGDSVRDSVWASVGASVWASVSDSVRDSVGDSVRDSVRDSVWASVGASVGDSVWASVSDSVWASVSDSKLINYISPYFEGSLDANIYSFFNYFNEVVGINYDKVQKHYDWWCSTVKFGQIFPLDTVCIISQKPIEINQKGNKLHAEGKPAVKYSDGFSVWALNGVRVPQYLAETPASALNIDFFKKEQNADVKAEFIRKYGIERMVSLGKQIDTWENHEGTNNFDWYKKSEYKLIDMSSIFTTYDYLPYLYMKNQTVPGIYHLECCYDPNTSKQPQTILEGLKVRLNGVDPETLEITAIA
ncbi:MAG: hypothetical protein NC191_04430 [Muribaculaceae bacterium]|nr:hypothetical protein [Muribaculaceae bacterium]